MQGIGTDSLPATQPMPTTTNRTSPHPLAGSPARQPFHPTPTPARHPPATHLAEDVRLPGRRVSTRHIQLGEAGACREGKGAGRWRRELVGGKWMGEMAQMGGEPCSSSRIAASGLFVGLTRGAGAGGGLRSGGSRKLGGQHRGCGAHGGGNGVEMWRVCAGWVNGLLVRT